MYCHKCGGEVADGAKFCTHCGAAVESAASAPDPTPNPAASSSKRLRKRSPVIPIAGGVAAALVVAAVAIFALGGGGGPTPDGSGASSPAVSAHGKTIEAMARPALFAPDSMDSYSRAVSASVPAYAVDSNLGNVANIDEVYLSDEVRSMLAESQFVVIEGNAGHEFYEIYERNRYSYDANFVTVDSLMHTYHLYFSYLLKNTERGYLAPALSAMSQSMLSASVAQRDELVGTEWEQAAYRNVVFFAVGASLLDSSTQVPDYASSEVGQILSLVYAASGIADNPLTGEGTFEDFSQYEPRGYYAGDAALERYFRAMMWYGRINFTQASEDLDRSALLMTLALRDAALDDWSEIYTVTAFFAGASDDCGYYEYYPIAASVYGEGVKAADLAGKDEEWASYHEYTAAMPGPKVNSIAYEEEDPANPADPLAEQKGFRLMGQRFTIDEAILQNLVYPNVPDRTMPNALDVTAALGSDEALRILEDRGDATLSGYSTNMEGLRGAVTQAPDSFWSASLYSQWIYTLRPLLDEKGDGYPAFMQGSAWNRKNLQSFLGSYAELKHDTILYAKQVMVEMGGGEIPIRDDRGYVEPEPEVFARLAALTKATSAGLQGYGIISSGDVENLGRLEQLAASLSDIAAAELTGGAISDDDYELIRTYGGQIEHFWYEVCKDEAASDYFTSREFPAAIIADVATDANAGTCLEVGTGDPSTIYVIVPIDGQPHIASGAVYSFYQFEQPISNRLTDTRWREMMGIEMDSSGTYNQQTQALESWTDDFTYSYRW